MKQSAGILVYRLKNDAVEVMLVHPGGPIWGKRDMWSIPKGELDSDKNLIEAAKREFNEETDFQLPNGELVELGSARQSNAKTNYVWAIKGNFELANFSCTSLAKMEWPPKSGQMQEFPENDKADWFKLSTAKQKIFPAQIVFIDRLAEYLQVELPVESKQQSLL